MRSRPATYGGLVFFSLVIALGAASPAAAAGCPTLSYTAPTTTTISPPQDCPFMLVKVWGNGAVSGFGHAVSGKGGGGAAIVALYEVSSADRFDVLLKRNVAYNWGWGGMAAVMRRNGVIGPPLILAAGGGGGGAAWYPEIQNPQAPNPHGGAGGATGKPGLSAAGKANNQTHTVHPGLGGTEGAGGAGGTGFGPHPDHNGQPGGLYPCEPNSSPNCGFHGAVLGGHGGQGWYGGGGGGANGSQGEPSGGNAGAGGGGGASHLEQDPHLLYSRIYDGDSDRPGNADDPDRQGAGQGGIPTPCPPCGANPGTDGRIVIKFTTLEIDPEQTTRWKPLKADTQPVDIVFTSPVELNRQRGRLDILDPSGATVVSDAQPLEPLFTGEPTVYRYKLPWKGPWTQTVGGQTTHLPRGNYRVTVRAQPAGSNQWMTSAPYDRVSLVEVSSVTLEMQGSGQALLPNPTLVAIPGQAPSQERMYKNHSDQSEPGKRIFGEAASVGAQETRAVTVRITTSPTITDLPASSPITVTVRAVDVDDPARGAGNVADLDLDADPQFARDNRGTPQCGNLGGSAFLCKVELSIPSGQSSVSTTFVVSGQPGDNYRIVASTSSSWAAKLFATQPSNFGEIRIQDGSTPGAPVDCQECVSDMVTVWRTLHLELDTTTPLPTSDTDYERNFIRGDVIALTAGLTEIGGEVLELRPQATLLPLGLDDGSPNLDHGGGWGRFESGTLEFGTAPLSSTIDGNGDTKVKRAGGFDIPFRLVAPLVGAPLDGFILRWDEASQQFEASVLIPVQYNGGTLYIAGASWPRVSVNGPLIMLNPSFENPPPAFRLVDDDEAIPQIPFSSLLTPGAQTPTANILLQAYIDVTHLPSNGKTAPFLRNVAEEVPTLPLEQQPITRQLCRGRDATTIHLEKYWSGYVQGGFQGSAYSDADVLGDNDPKDEADVALGVMPGLGGPHNSAIVFLESIRDIAAAPHGPPPPAPQCPYGSACPLATAISVTTAHELGHVLGVPNDDGAIMTPECRCTPTPYYSAQSLARIRWFTGPASPSACVGVNTSAEPDEGGQEAEPTPDSEGR